MASKPGRVFVAGSANIDLVAGVPRLPAAGETVLAGSFQTLPGGKGANQAVAAAKAGSAVTFFGCVGEDPFADKLTAVLTEAGIDLTFLERSPLPTGAALIAVDAAGQNQIAVFPGANASLRFRDEFRQAAPGDVLLCQNECPLDVIHAYLKAARRQGVRAVLNAAPVVALPNGLLREVDVLVVNEEEAAQYCLRIGGGSAPRDAEEQAKTLQLRSEQIVVVTLGERGLRAFANGRVIRVPGHNVDAVDTTGAGDCFCGYLASCLAAGTNLDDGLALANAAAALAVQRPGASVAMPSRAEVEAFLRLRDAD
jgi:ribokinase